MPSTTLGALPARFRRERLLIVGCGDVGLRVAHLAGVRMKLLALTSSVERVSALRTQGITPLVGDLDQPATLQRLSGIATRVLYLAPPPSHGTQDPRALHGIRALRLRTRPRSLVYGSTTGVYGDQQGNWACEHHGLQPTTSRAQRRVDAENHFRFLNQATGVRTAILRIPGIYAADRPRYQARSRLQAGTPVLVAEHDVYTNHIHANDLARACLLALWRGHRVYNVSDDSQLKMGDYYDLLADHWQLPRPPRLTPTLLAQQVGSMAFSFMQESRRIANQRMKNELGLRLRYPTVQTSLDDSI